jgi:hypothetical protein
VCTYKYVHAFFKKTFDFVWHKEHLSPLLFLWIFIIIF